MSCKPSSVASIDLLASSTAAYARPLSIGQPGLQYGRAPSREYSANPIKLDPILPQGSYSRSKSDQMMYQLDTSSIDQIIGMAAYQSATQMSQTKAIYASVGGSTH